MKNHIITSFYFSIIISVLFSLGACDEYVYITPVETDDGWETGTTESVGIDQSNLDEMMSNIRQRRNHKLHSILIVKGNKLVFEEYFDGYTFGFNPPNWEGTWTTYDRDTLHWTGSATKSFTSAVVGIAIDQGYIASIDKEVYKFFPEYANQFDESRKRITIRHILTNTAGYSWNENEIPYDNDTNDLIRFARENDPWGYLFSKAMIHEPGTSFYYASTNTLLAGEIVKRATGFNADEFSAPTLFTPLGITNYYWVYLRPDLVFTSGDMDIRPRDMAKFGLLFLNRGLWNGERIISEEWVMESTTEVVDITPGMHNSYSADGYALAWWNKTFSVDGRDVYSYSAQGWGGQMIYVFPEFDAVVVFTQGYWAAAHLCDTLLPEYIIPAFVN